MKLPRILIPALLLLAALMPAHGQIAVQIEIKRRLHILHEPILATVTVTNNSGRDVTLEDSKAFQWFGFRINGVGDSIIPPRNPDYHLDPITIKSSETVRRAVNLTELYALGDFGAYKVSATIYCKEMDRFFPSQPRQIELTEGTVIWRKSAGVPENRTNGGATHVFTLLTHQVDQHKMLYVRVEDRDASIIYGCYPLGHILGGPAPTAEFDTGNNMYIMHLVGNKAWMLSKIGVNGEFMGQTVYNAEKSRPMLRRLTDGTLQIVGGRKEIAAQNIPKGPPAKLSDRPEGLPQ